MSDLQKDLVLSSNEYSYVLDQTKGFISCLVGPTKMSLSQSDSLVTFNTHTKKFESCSYGEAIKLLTICPENWYCILKNPTKDNKHPAPGASNVLPDTKQVAVFDTAFHHTIPEDNYIYAIPYEWYTKYKVRKYQHK